MTSFSFEDYYHLAEELIGNQDEAYIRSAISRYYYAIFGLARQYLVEAKDYKYLSKHDSNNHRMVSAILSSSKDGTENAVGAELNNLRRKRNQADYDLDFDTDYFIDELDHVRKKAGEALDSMKYLINREKYFVK